MPNTTPAASATLGGNTSSAPAGAINRAKTRDESLDIVAGLLIIWMMLSHAGAGADYFPPFYGWIDRALYFFMPWFFFKAGMFFRVKPRREFLRSNWKRLLVPFLAFSLLGYVMWLPGVISQPGLSLTYKIGAPIVQLLKEGSVTANIPLWFLLSLFLVKGVANEALLRRWNVWITGAVGLAIGLGLYLIGEVEPLWVANSAVGLAFFMLGYVLHSPAAPSNRVRGWLDGRIIYIVALTLFVLHNVLCPGSMSMRTNTFSGVVTGYGTEYLLWFVASVLGILLLNKGAKWRPLRYTGLHVVGRDSMGYLAVHQLVINVALVLVAAIFPWADGPVRLTGCVVLGVLLMPPLNRLWKRLGWI
ncbi:MAG: acyltransferase [Candidatus Amulumruptor caecigallinarius]|nr:acyltransferase [Candidatus Amulumruptor caecigallinarius]MCM1397759.1 acyltransferase [Candidatus Amulumruptor caecigallinarius]MCM1454499.1 acyltransferase [bacterium]